MKKLWILLVVMLFGGTVIACSYSKHNLVAAEPEIEQIRSICNLATLECYYHNVAKSVKTAGSGISHIGEKERKFWIEYTGIAKVGIDMSRVLMEIEGENVSITIPKAELLSINVEEKTLNKDSFILSADGLNENKITAKDQTDAIENTQKEMEESVKNNSSLLITAQNRAKKLIENYINQLGEISGINYKIIWVYEDNMSDTENKSK